jgi:lipoate-protein ligase A
LLVIFDKCQDPYFNLASEEFLLAERRFAQPVIRLWQNSPAVIVGRFQNTLAEINREFVAEKSIAVVRRITGGGAVYHDLGNVNYTVAQPTSGKIIDFAHFTEPVIELLAGYGIKAENHGRNDIEACGCKISGGAQTIKDNRVLHHGTLLFAVKLDTLAQALRAKEHKLATRGVSSIRERVGNIVDFMRQPLPVEVFLKDLEKHFLKQPGSRPYEFSAREQAAIQKLRDDKYSRWEWNYGQSPDFNIERTVKYPWGELALFLLAKGGRIEEISVYGDFFSQSDVRGAFRKLRGAALEEASLREKIRQMDLAAVLPELTEQELLAQLLNAA